MEQQIKALICEYEKNIKYADNAVSSISEGVWTEIIYKEVVKDLNKILQNLSKE